MIKIEFKLIHINKMKNSLRLIAIIALATLSLSSFAQKKKKKNKQEVKEEVVIGFTSKYDTASYMIGQIIGANFAEIPAKDQLSVALMQKGLADVFADTGMFSKEEIQAFLNVFMKEQQEIAEAAEKEDALKEEKAFFEENRTKEGIIELESGLQYKVVREGTGIKPEATDKVKVHYTGKLLDGTVFDSSVERGEPIEFGLNQVIKGWTEGLQHMQEGAVHMIYIPAELGYGSRGAGQVIKPYSTLVFEVELLEVIKPGAGE